MKRLVISRETDLPIVDFDQSTGILSIGGSSLPENVLETYTPILNWLTEYFKNPHSKTQFVFEFEYLNTASTNVVAHMARLIRGFIENKHNATITWFYPADDFDIRDLGEELFEDITCPFNLIENKDE